MNEIEYKWKKNSKEISLEINNYNVKILNVNSIDITAEYYDSEDSILKKSNMALRKRNENGINRCYLKMSNITNQSYNERKEYMLETNDINYFIRYIISNTKNSKLKKTLDELKIYRICQIIFLRESIMLEIFNESKSCIAELCFDKGNFVKNDKTKLFEEIELEYKSGNIELFHEFANKFMIYNSLDIESKSKIARAMKL